jgi:Tfp pilus assembly pilus retraction ATPase PilT
LYSSSLRTTNVLDGERTKEISFSERDPERGRVTPKTISHISSIRSRNLAGVKGGYDDCDEIFLNLEAHNQDGSNLVVVTGETGSGKSLLVSKVADLVTGGKATASLLHTPKDTSVDPSASVEMGT